MVRTKKPKEEPVTAEELMARLLADPDWVARRDKAEQQRQFHVAKNRADAAELVEALRQEGFAIDGIADLFNQRHNYQRAIPILLGWLPSISNSHVKQDVVRALSVRKWATPRVAPALVKEFESAEDDSGTGLRWTIGNALEAVADQSVHEDLIRLALDRRYGRAREMLVLALGRLSDDRSLGALLELLEDDEVSLMAMSALGKRKATVARPKLEGFLKHPDSSLRKEAKKALEKLDRAKRPRRT